MKVMKIKKFITYSEAEKYNENELSGWGGYFKKGMRWEDYLNRFTEKGKPFAELLRKAIIKNKIKCTGAEHQHSSIKSVALWDDDTVSVFSYRGWGDLMAAIWSTEENKDYRYMDFYM
jgi:hypothetical protein